MAMLTTGEIAAAVGRTPAAVRAACAAGKLAGAECQQTPRGPVWMVPAEYADPARYAEAVGRPWRKQGKVG